jgi:hypothetical protein
VLVRKTQDLAMLLVGPVERDEHEKGKATIYGKNDLR